MAVFLFRYCLNLTLFLIFRLFKKLTDRDLKNFRDNIYFLIGGKPQLTFEL